MDEASLRELAHGLLANGSFGNINVEIGLDGMPDHFVVLTPQPGVTPLALNTAAASGVFR
jgi:hypothetical protein